jgi:hypothetical protein
MVYILEEKIYFNEQTKFILEIIRFIKKDNFLDIGSGNCFLTSIISKYFRNTTAVDNDTQCNYDNINFVNMDFYNFKSLIKYDLILCSHYFAHVENKNEHFDKIMSMLNKKGVLIIFNHVKQGFFETILWELPSNYYINKWLISNLMVSMIIHTYDADIANNIQKLTPT